MKIFLIIITFICLLASCAKKNQDPISENSKVELSEPDSIFYSLKDTTHLFEISRVDSTELPNFKNFVEANAFRFEGDSVNNIDAEFEKTIESINDYVRIQKIVDVDLNVITEIFFNRVTADSTDKNYLEISVTNESQKIINAVKLRLTGYDIYQDFKGAFDYEIIADLKPQQTYQERLNLYFSTSFDIHFGTRNPLYVVTKVERLVLSDNTDLDGRLNGSVYNYSEYDIPNFYEGERGHEIHGIFLDQDS